ncbi:tripartite tricarboxylate transporter substrate binding protein [Roseomonas sp. HF4]|uniref:Bug family tripartite tricarboxylate transporter substrate binding protein n=1 Tax=Roseomonas sp. HF4 TaxID=2562313 RepID=UPI0010C033B2|nr:tripartite tricarboxylate transporter substrate binding protein [Roseomonas sp. HF4]
MIRRRPLLAAAGAALALPARAQADWPNRPLRLIVPYGAGNVTDVVARLLADDLGTRLGQNVVVENLPGAGGTIGTAALVRAAPDGYTIGLVAKAAVAVIPQMMRNPPYDPLRDLEPLGPVVVTGGSFLTLHPSVPATSVAELVATVKAGNPSPFFYYSAGSGTFPHLNMEALRLHLGFAAEHVPYRSSAAGLADLLAGRVHATLDTAIITAPHIQSGRLRAIAFTADRRSPILPDVPTIAEVVPGLDLSSPWLAALGPRGIPPAVLARLQAAIRASATALVPRLPANVEPDSGTPEEFGARMRADHARFGPLIAAIGLRLD